MDKIYTLPDILPAPYSDLQALVRRLIEYADWTTLPAIMDEMQGQGRHRDLADFRQELVRIVHPVTSSAYWQMSFGAFCSFCSTLFWFDLFSLDATTSLLIEKCKPIKPPSMSRRTLVLPERASYLMYIAEEDIPNGSLVVIGSMGGVRRAPAQVNSAPMQRDDALLDSAVTNYGDSYE